MNRILCFFRDAGWMNAQRMRGYMVILAIGLALGLGYHGYLLWDVARHDALHRLPACDFADFWASAKFAADHRAAQIYDPARLDALIRATTSRFGANDTLPYFYPPSYLLITWPLGYLPYAAGFAVFTVFSYLVFVASARAVWPRRWALLPIIAMPATVVTLRAGQNGAITATIFILGALWLDTRPLAAGVMLGLLTLKPQFALCAPIALLAARRWRALIGMIAGAGAINLLALACFGLETWRQFLTRLPVINAALLYHREDWARQLSWFSSVRVLGLGLPAAYVIQGGVTVACLILLVRLSRHRPAAPAQIALIAAATLLCTPHLNDYDLTVTLPVFGFIMTDAARSGFLPWEKWVMFLAYLLPIVARQISDRGYLPIAAPILLALFAITCRRIGRRPAPIAPV